MAIGCGHAVDTSDVLASVASGLELLQDLSLRCQNDVGWDCADAEALSFGGESISMEFDGDELGIQGGCHVRSAEHFPLHHHARSAPIGPEMDEDQPIGLSGDLPGVLQIPLPSHARLLGGDWGDKPPGQDCGTERPVSHPHGLNPRSIRQLSRRRLRIGAVYLSDYGEAKSWEN
jgi:hypothetical protein